MHSRLTLATMIVLATVLLGFSASAVDCPRGFHLCGNNTCCQD